MLPFVTWFHLHLALACIQLGAHHNSQLYFCRAALQPAPSQMVHMQEGSLVMMQNSTVLFFIEPHEVSAAQSSMLLWPLWLEALLFTMTAVLPSLGLKKLVRVHSASSQFSVEVTYDCSAWCISSLQTLKPCFSDFLIYYKNNKGCSPTRCWSTIRLHHLTRWSEHLVSGMGLTPNFSYSSFKY